MRKIVCWICIISILFSGVLNVAALTSGYRREEITINTSTDYVNCFTELKLYSNTSGKIICSLQKNTGANWQTLATWTASGSNAVVINQSWPVDAGFTYRMYVTYSIYDTNGNLVEQEVHTVSKHYPREFEYNAITEESLSE